MTANINSVPRDVTVETLSYFDYKELGKFATVCKEWKNSVDDPRLWGAKNGPNGPNAKARYVQPIQTAQNILKRLNRERDELLQPTIVKTMKEWAVLPTRTIEKDGILALAFATLSIFIFEYTEPNQATVDETRFLLSAGFECCFGALAIIITKVIYSDFSDQVQPTLSQKVEKLNVKIEKWEHILAALHQPKRAKEKPENKLVETEFDVE